MIALKLYTEFDRTIKAELPELISVSGLEELLAITRKNEGRVIIHTEKSYDWDKLISMSINHVPALYDSIPSIIFIIEIYNDYRE